MSAESIESFLAIALGFAVAGLVSTGYQLLTDRIPSFHLLGGGPRPATFAAVPLLAFAAPFIIMRNTLRGRRIERRRFEFVALGTIAAAMWSMLSGTVLVMAFEAIERLVA
jgi:O-antigen/teichoic acid export membrane protein